MVKNIIILIYTVILFTFSVLGQSADKCYLKLDYKPVNMRNVVITDGLLHERQEVNTKITIPHCLKECEKSGCVHNLKLACGLIRGSYIGDNSWLESDIYKSMEAAFYGLVNSPNKVLLNKLDSLVDLISCAQKEDGYLYLPRIDNATNETVVKFMGKERWTNLGHFSHELYTMGHMIEAAVANYQLNGDEKFLNIAKKTADLIVSTFTPTKLTYPPGHQEIELALVKLYKLTQNEKYLETARFLIDQRGHYKKRPAYTDEFFEEYHQDHKPVIDQMYAVGHVVRATYMYTGMADIATLTDDKTYKKALGEIWNDVVSSKMYITGGVGNQKLGEAFGIPYKLNNFEAYTETCASIGLALWNESMFNYNQDGKYFDIIERVMYNGILSGLSQDGKHFFYQNPLASDGNFKRQEWYGCACCPPNISRYIASVGNRMYGVEKEDIYVNIYASNKANITTNTNQIDIIQTTDYPWDGHIVLKVAPKKEEVFTIKLRIPGWALDKPVTSNLYQILSADLNDNNPTIKINGKLINYSTEKGFAQIERQWIKGDIIELDLPMKAQRIIANNKVEVDNGRVTVAVGPVVYCLEGEDNKNLFDVKLSDKTPLSIEKGNGIFAEMNLIVAEIGTQKEKDVISKKKLKFIPYFMWGNRMNSEMQVWNKRFITNN